MSTCHPGSHDKSKDGIALIIVLGFLSVLLILAVGFVVAMRTERMAARNHADVTRARQLVDSGLARAINEIDQNLSLPPPALVYPPWDTFTSTNVPFTTNVVDLLKGDATNFIPRSLYMVATNDAQSVVWSNIVDPVSGQLVGRFGYIAINCSGLLDVSTAGSKDVNRGHGTNANEIVLSFVPEMMPSQLYTNFFPNRTSKWVRFESVPEILSVASNMGVKSFSSNLFFYSRFPPGKQPNGISDLINISTNENGLIANESVIKAALSSAGVSNVNGVFENLLDYVDSDSIPNHPALDVALTNFNTEAVPMLNEIVFSNLLTKLPANGGSATQYVHDVWLKIETWFPFPGSKPVDLYPTPPLITFTTIPTELNPDSTSPSPTPTYTIAHTPAKPFVITELHFRQGYTNAPIPANGRVSFRATFPPDSPLELQLGGQPVDRVDLSSLDPATLTLRIDGVPAQPLGVAGAKGVASGASVSDPRLNYLVRSVGVPGDNGGWFQDNPNTLGTTNRRAIRTDTGLAVGEGVSEMFVRNGPLQSAAELGYLSVGKPWRTIALYSTAGEVFHPVLDYFTVRPVPTNSYQGLVNLNTTNVFVMGAVLAGAPIESYPDKTNFVTTWTAAYSAASAIIQTRTSEFFGVSEIGLATSYFAAPGFLDSMYSDARRESFIRNSYELFSLRQNLFTIILAAQAMDTNANVLAEQHALAVVWRDPYVNANGNHVSFVRFFKWLSE